MFRYPAIKRLFFSVRSRVAVFALLATLLPSITLGWLSYQRNSDVLTQKTAHELDNAASVAAREIDLWLKDRIEEMRIFGSSYLITESLEKLAGLSRDAKSLRGPLTTRMRDYLTSVANRFPGYSGLQVVFPDGSFVYGSQRNLTQGLPRNWLRTTTAGKVVIGEPHWSDQHREMMVTLAVPVRSGRGQALGALVATANSKAISEILKRASLSDGQLKLVDHTGTSIHLASEKANAGEPRSSPIVPATFLEYDNEAGTAAVGTFRPVAEQDWGVLAERTRSVVFAQLDEIRNTTLKLLVLLLVAVGIGAYWIGLTIVHPLDRLVAAANRVAMGDLNVTVPIAHRDELGYLAERFNEMTGQLRRNREELADANDALVRKNIELEAISITDPLTSLYNRRHLMDVLDREFQEFARTGRTFSLLIVDLDHFKRVNDTYGHPAGDAVLTMAARVMRDAIRGIDYAARFGGEEFVVLLVNTGQEEAHASAERIRSRIENSEIEFNGTRISITASIGLAEVGRENDTTSALIARADAALYDAKQQGRNRVCRHQAKIHRLHPGQQQS